MAPSSRSLRAGGWRCAEAHGGLWWRARGTTGSRRMLLATVGTRRGTPDELLCKLHAGRFAGEVDVPAVRRYRHVLLPLDLDGRTGCRPDRLDYRTAHAQYLHRQADKLGACSTALRRATGGGERERARARAVRARGRTLPNWERCIVSVLFSMVPRPCA